MKTHGYEEIEHTADLAIRAWGQDFHTLLTQAADGLYYLMGLELENSKELTQVFEIQGESQEILLVDFLNEILYHAEKNRVFSNFSFDQINDSLVITAYGYQAGGFKHEIKAATFHNLSIDKKGKALEATITFDV